MLTEMDKSIKASYSMDLLACLLTLNRIIHSSWTRSRALPPAGRQEVTAYIARRRANQYFQMKISANIHKIIGISRARGSRPAFQSTWNPDHLWCRCPLFSLLKRSQTLSMNSARSLKFQQKTRTWLSQESTPSSSLLNLLGWQLLETEDLAPTSSRMMTYDHPQIKIVKSSQQLAQEVIG